jgi:hypothetical protein
MLRQEPGTVTGRFDHRQQKMFSADLPVLPLIGYGGSLLQYPARVLG